MARTRKSSPDSGPGFEIQVLNALKWFTSHAEAEKRHDILALAMLGRLANARSRGADGHPGPLRRHGLPLTSETSGQVVRCEAVLNLSTTTSQKCEAVPRRARS